MSSVNGNTRFGILFAILVVTLSAFAFIWRQYALVVAWPIVTCTFLSFGYLGLAQNVFGKRPDGTLKLINSFCLLPYLTIYHAIWHVRRLMGHNPRCDEIRPGLFVSRRLYGRELPVNVDLIIDLTSEFAEPKRLRMVANYVSLPILDGGAISLADITGAVSKITDHEGSTLIHCAEGNGRSVMIAAAVLLSEGEAHSVSSAVDLIRVHRPSARLRPPQHQVLEILLDVYSSNRLLSTPGSVLNESH